MRLTSARRQYAREHTTPHGTFWFHPGIPAQSYHVSDFMSRQDVNMEGMNWIAHLFYATQGFLIDYEGNNNALADYLADVDGKSLDEAWLINQSHPLMTHELYTVVNDAFLATRDASMQADDIPESDEEIEKKEKV